ncbi:MAG TPA: hypothetical protein VLX56_06025 [Nitrososphaerales archaeon]|nr:hypothetical protein [Nitrososphaerales archaeon]
MVAMALVSVAVFQLALEGGVNISMKGGRIVAFKGEEYETDLTIESRVAEWVGTMPPTVHVETGRLVKTETLPGGKVRLRFVGTYAGRLVGIKVGVALTDPLRIYRRVEQVVFGDLVLDTLPLSLLASATPRRLTIFGFGDQPTGYPGPGMELYGLDKYHSGDTKDIVWKRVAKSPTEDLTARVREGNVRDIVRVGVIQFAERGDAKAPWIDLLCEALARVGKEVIAMGATMVVVYDSPRGGDETRADLPGLNQASASDDSQLTEAVMSCSAAPPSRNVGAVTASSDFVVTGLRELDDPGVAGLLSRKAVLLIAEGPSSRPPPAVRSLVYSGVEDLTPLVRRVLEA